tara:strand:+ start:431 stop:586 length:156 start_codon:yes stop_codon:yes gene_type:complete
MVLQGQMELKEILELRVLKVDQVEMDLKVKKVNQDLTVLQGLMDLMELKGI